MKNQNTVVMLDFKGNVSSNKSDARSRHVIYGQRLGNLSKESPLKFVVISRGDISKSDHSDLIDFHEIKCLRFDFLKFIVFGIRVIRNNGYSTKVLVCGDPWESFILGKIFQITLRSNSKLQLQVHADISDSKWRYANLANQLRSIFHKYTFNHCDQIRVVSRNLQIYINSISRNKNIIIVPIPIITSQREVKVSSNSAKSLRIGFFGRIQKDRGTDVLLSLVNKLNTQRQDFAIFIAGQGSEESDLRRDLVMSIGAERVHFLGQLIQIEVWNALSKLDVYFSLAPAESYGLGIREAIIAGVPVIALESNGARDASEGLGNGRVKLIDSTISGITLSKILDEVLAKVSDMNHSFEMIELNLTYVDTLIESWVDLARSNKGQEKSR